jgi:hypothetical protein
MASLFILIWYFEWLHCNTGFVSVLKIAAINRIFPFERIEFMGMRRYMDENRESIIVLDRKSSGDDRGLCDLHESNK